MLNQNLFASLTHGLWLAALLGGLSVHAAEPAKSAWFKIQVVDEQTGRGVPLVELETTHRARYYTDSQGLVAFHEPGLMNQSVFFHVRSHGYEFPKDGFGYAGKALKVTPGGSATLKVKRVNIAERLYRQTGGGIYRDSVLLGEKVPLKEPVLNGQVLGQDTVMVVPYRGKLYWFWGDTSKPAYPLGNFGTSGATSELPGKGGLDPSVGVDFTYFVNKEGFSRPLIKLNGEGPIWVHGMFTVPDTTGRERIVTHYMRVQGLEKMHEHGLAVFNDDTEMLDKLVEFDLKEQWRRPQQHPVKWNDGTGEHFYFSAPYPNVRVKADWRSVTNALAYEALTCLENTGEFNAETARVKRDANGRAHYFWTTNAAPLGYKDERKLIESGKLKPEEARYQLKDADSGKPIDMHVGSIYWNEYRKRWIMIGEQIGGTSLLGEIWFAEAVQLAGPWEWARKIVTHNRYSFYNPTQHPYFDQEGGRIIYFEGTYTESFTDAPVATPYYEYNQIMYRLDLSDPRLGLPLKRKE